MHAYHGWSDDGRVNWVCLTLGVSVVGVTSSWYCIIAVDTVDGIRLCTRSAWYVAVAVYTQWMVDGCVSITPEMGLVMCGGQWWCGVVDSVSLVACGGVRCYDAVRGEVCTTAGMTVYVVCGWHVAVHAPCWVA
jgi:hypothetical protein